VSWEEAAPDFIEAWGQGEHLIALGKTGRGKTTFVNDILNRRHEQREASIASVIVKKRDTTSSDLLSEGWHRITEWPPPYAARKARKVMLWPTYTKASTFARDIRSTVLDAIDEIMEEGQWTLYLDEAPYFVESLKLRTSMDELFNQARSNGITLVAGMQRPVWVSRSAVSQHGWVGCFRIGDMEDAKRAGEVIGDRDRYTPVILGLQGHQFLLADTIGDRAIISEIGT
jgi:hypothetical protein